MESFFDTYPPEKAESLLWRWFMLSIKDKFSQLPPKVMLEFTDFFERLENLILAMDIVRKQSKNSKGMRQGSPASK